MKKHIVATLIIISLALGAGCQTAIVVTDSTTTTPQSTAILPPSTVTATVTPTGTPTEVPIASLTSEQLAEKYLNGEFRDVGNLSPEQLSEFSKSVTARLEERRGSNVLYNTYMGERYFINPDTLKLELAPPNPDEEFSANNTIEMYLPIGKDAAGNLQIHTNEEIITIPNSANVDWSMLVTDPHDPRINWPTTEKGVDPAYPDLTMLQSLIAAQNNPRLASALIPAVILDKEIGEIALESGNAFRRTPFLKIAMISPDGTFARVSLLIDSGSINLYQEGTDLDISSIPQIRKHRDFWEALEENTFYYFGFLIDQPQVLQNNIFASTGNLSGFAPVEQNYNVLTGEQQNQDQMLLVLGHALIKKND